MKLNSHSIAPIKQLLVTTAPTEGTPLLGFKKVISQILASEKAVQKGTPAVPKELSGILQLQRTCSNLQLQVECVSRVADSVSASVKKIQQLGGQG